MSTLERAIAIAAEAHAGQSDKGGAPYILHPLRVMMAVGPRNHGIVAVLHDVLEDCPDWTRERLEDEGFSPILVDALEALTRRKGETYEDFIQRVKRNPIATRVKLADLDDNSDLRRIPKPGPEDFKRLRKYADAITALIGA
jgi:(p)ppGpp synthase/HD superfamily hydrolase